MMPHILFHSDHLAICSRCCIFYNQWGHQRTEVHYVHGVILLPALGADAVISELCEPKSNSDRKKNIQTHQVLLSQLWCAKRVSEKITPNQKFLLLTVGWEGESSAVPADYFSSRLLPQTHGGAPRPQAWKCAAWCTHECQDCWLW